MHIYVYIYILYINIYNNHINIYIYFGQAAGLGDLGFLTRHRIWAQSSESTELTIGPPADFHIDLF